MKTFARGRIHFVGIGGAGMSAIAKVLVERGVEVSGSDLKRSRDTSVLEAMGVPVHIGHDAALVEGASVVVVSAAIPESNPERLRAPELGVPVVTRGEALAALLEGRRAIVVAGTHGKTTTTSMVVSILRAAGEDPTYLVGGGLNDVGTNARSGASDLAVAESDESDGSFLLLDPHVAVVTNVESDHLDHWGSLEAVRAAFTRFIARADTSGGVAVPADDADLLAAATSSGAPVVTFGTGGDLNAADISLAAGGATFTLERAAERVDVRLLVPGA
ncbi:MAG: UDP-N-acetylmuramate--L-alanine ligase, partial [Actinomycetota bacterium]